MTTATTLALVLTACGESPPSNPEPAGQTPEGSGGEGLPGAGAASARLVAWRIGVEGAGTLTVHVLDRELGRPCAFATATDGVLRCLPVDPRPRELWGAFADPACQQRVYGWMAGDDAPAASAPKYVTAESWTRGRVEVREAVLRPDLKQYFMIHGDGKCRPTEPPTIQPGTTLIAAGSVVAPSTFVEGRRVVVAPAAGDRLGVEQIETSSGGPFVTGIHDPRWQRSCQLEKGASGHLAPCWPGHARSSGTWFADARCTKPIASWQGNSAPAVVVIRDANNRAFKLGSPWTGTAYMGGRGCTAASVRERATAYFEIGEPLASDAIAMLRWTQYGSGRARIQLPTGESGRVFEIGLRSVPAAMPLLDTGRGAECEPVRAPDGAIRCVSKGGDLLATDSFFEDSRCSRPLVFCMMGRCEALSILAVAPDQDVGPPSARLHAVGKRFTGPVHIRYPHGGCESTAVNGFPDLWQLGPEIGWDGFPRLDEWRGSERVLPPGP